MAADVVVTYHAREQFSRLSRQEQASLKRLLGEPTNVAQATQVGGSDRFVSRLGGGKRVHWRKSDDGKIVVLSVVAA